MKLQGIRITAFTAAIALCSTTAAFSQDASSTAAQDKTFVMKAGMGSFGEIALSQLALKKSKNEEVKTFAQKMVEDHTKLISDMKPFADTMGVPPPTKPTPEGKIQAERLGAMKGDNFDKEYITSMVADHHKDLAEFQAEEASTANQDLKATVSKGKQVVKDHTDMIDAMAQKKGINTPPMPAM